ncbi:MAG: PHP domain-containing protein [Planctomycetaceae bacterium]|nr:PHP domain-containing protein [Planctomycetaceae bacterium]
MFFDCRHFLKQLALLGAVVVTSFSFAFGQNEPAASPPPDGSFTVQFGEVLPKKKPPRVITIPDVGEYKVLKGDFHIHTVFSDGVVLPKDRVAEAVDNGLDVIAITDHVEYRPHFGGNGTGIKLLDKNDDYNIAYDLAKPVADEKNLILVRAVEITKRMPPGHFNALFLKDANPVAAVVDDWRQMIAVAVEQGAFIQWNHPGAVNPNFGFPDGPMRFTDEHEEIYQKGHLHGVEVFNGFSFYPVAMQWCIERDLAMMGDSDIHPSEWDRYGYQNPLRPMTLILAKERSYDSVREAFFAKRTIAFAAGMVIGRQEWLEKLFKACVTMTSKPGLLVLVNKSDIPCQVQAGGVVCELPPQGKITIYRSDSMNKLTVSNWRVGVNQPLEITLPR